MRRQFGKTMVELARQDERIIWLYGDVKQNADEFEREFPDRIFNCGIAEQSMVSMAAGMALQGLRPVVYSLTPFLIERAFESWKMDVDVMNAPVIGCGYSAYETHGPSQTPLNPQVMVGLLKNVLYYQPADMESTAIALRNAVASNKPAFISLTRGKGDLV